MRKERCVLQAPAYGPNNLAFNHWNLNKSIWSRPKRISSMEVEHYKTEEDAKPRIVSLCLQISPIFQQAQTSVANHNKNSVALYKTFEQLAHIGRKSRKEGYFKTYGETPFKEAFEGCFTRSLGVKKGEASADRVAKFVGAFIKHLNEKGSCIN